MDIYNQHGIVSNIIVPSWTTFSHLLQQNNFSFVCFKGFKHWNIDPLH